MNDMKNCSGIYKIECKGECVYIGQSINLRSRKGSHLRKLKKHNHCNIYLQRLFDKYESEITFSVIEECQPNILTERELFWINKLKPKCNMQIPVDSTHFTVTDETRKKMSDIVKKRMTPEMKKKISDKTKEAMHRPDVWNNFIKGQNSKKNKTPWNKGLKGVTIAPNRKKVYCFELDKVFSSAYEAGLYFGAKNGKGISRVCLGERNKYKNMHFKYIKE